MKKFFKNNDPEEIFEFIGSSIFICAIWFVACLMFDMVFFPKDVPPVYNTEIVDVSGNVGVFVENDE